MAGFGIFRRWTGDEQLAEVKLPAGRRRSPSFAPGRRETAAGMMADHCAVDCGGSNSLASRSKACVANVAVEGVFGAGVGRRTLRRHGVLAQQLGQTLRLGDSAAGLFPPAGPRLLERLDAGVDSRPPSAPPYVKHCSSSAMRALAGRRQGKGQGLGRSVAGSVWPCSTISTSVGPSHATPGSRRIPQVGRGEQVLPRRGPAAGPGRTSARSTFGQHLLQRFVETPHRLGRRAVAPGEVVAPQRLAIGLHVPELPGHLVVGQRLAAPAGSWSRACSRNAAGPVS